MKDLFPIQYNDQLDRVSEHHDQDSLTQLFAHPSSASEPNRAFIGHVIAPRRFRLALLGTIAFLFFLLARSASLQLVHGEEYLAAAEQNRLWHRTIPSERGIIYDRNGMVLAENEPVFHILMAPEFLPADEERNDWIDEMASVLDETSQDIHSAWQTREEDMPVLLKEDAPYEFALTIMSQDENPHGLFVEITSRRSYATDTIPTLSHILGYTGSLNPDEYKRLSEDGYRPYDHAGKQGVEEMYEKTLRGTFGTRVMEVDALGSSLRIVSQTEPESGENLTLTIDAGLQSAIETALLEHLEGTPASRASVVVMNPNDGELLALASWPAYDANLFTAGIDAIAYEELTSNEDQPLFPRAFAGEYPSGSTIKPVHAATALIEGVITPSTTILSTGGINIGPWFFPDWRAGGHGQTDVYHAIADSVNTFFYLIGGGNETFDGLGIERMMDYAALFGFGEPSGLDVNGEGDGFLPTIEWKESVKNEPWYIGDTYHVAIGQGDFLVTPLQLTRAIAAFANGGSLVTPHLNSEEEVTSEPIIDEDTVEIISDAMRMTVTYGSAQYLQTVTEPVAGKTGTAQWSTIEAPHSWFTGFAPFDEPEVVITVLIEEGGDDYLAVPIARDVLNWWFSAGEPEEPEELAE